MASASAATVGRGREDRGADVGGGDRTRSRVLPVYLSMVWRLKCAFCWCRNPAEIASTIDQ